MALEGWRSVCSSAHLPCSPLSGPGSLVCSHWLCGLSIRSHCSSSHRNRLHSHLCRHTDSLQKCSAHWSTWRRSRCTSFLKRTKDGCHWYKTLGFLSSALDVVVDTLIALRKSPLALCFPSRIWSYQFPWRGGARWWHWWREPSWEPNGSLTCRETFEVQRQFVRAVGTVGVAVTLPLRAEKTATIPTAKLLWSTGAVHWKKREQLFHLAGCSFKKRWPFSTCTCKIREMGQINPSACTIQRQLPWPILQKSTFYQPFMINSSLKCKVPPTETEQMKFPNRNLVSASSHRNRCLQNQL